MVRVDCKQSLSFLQLATRDAKNEGGSLRRKKFLSRAFSHACAFLCVSFDGPRKERLLVVYGQGKDREISSCVRENSLRIQKKSRARRNLSRQRDLHHLKLLKHDWVERAVVKEGYLLRVNLPLSGKSRYVRDFEENVSKREVVPINQLSKSHSTLRCLLYSVLFNDCL